jgi:TRAP-type uncharacterized transport system substrate-binding protein
VSIKKLILFLFFLIGSFGCTNKDVPLKLVKVVEVGATKISDKPIVELLAEQNEVKVDLIFSEAQDSVINLLHNNEIDMAILPNSVKTGYKDIKTITSLLPRVLLIVYRPELVGTQSLEELIKGRKVGYENSNSDDQQIVVDFFNHYKIDVTKDLEPILVSDSLSSLDGLDIFITLTHIRNPIIYRLLEEGNLIYSLDNPELIDRGSSVDGFVLTSPNVYPFVLPKSVYSHGPHEPILTIGVRDILVCNESMNAELVYNIIETISENKTALTQRNKSYGLLDLDYNSINTSFAFPLHPGAVNYLTRDKPSFFERYAELTGVIISIFVILFGTLSQVRRYLKQRKKDRIDIFYKELLVLRSQYKEGDINSEVALETLMEIRSHAFNALMNEKLDANESFGIFLQLFDDVNSELTIAKIKS